MSLSLTLLFLVPIDVSFRVLIAVLVVLVVFLAVEIIRIDLAGLLPHLVEAGRPHRLLEIFGVERELLFVLRLDAEREEDVFRTDRAFLTFFAFFAFGGIGLLV